MKAKIEIEMELEITSASQLSSEQDLLDCITEDLPKGLQNVIGNITDKAKIISCNIKKE